ncbi:MAG: hypothetical protein JXA87_07835 [Thermoleophilia bacterium]|nr:hypothetical protein [Thermoleophilia bacterium]
MKVCFVVGQPDSPEIPGDTPEAYWRTLLPSKALGGQAVVIGARGAAEKALAAEVVWIYEPTSPAAASLAEVARQMGKPVVADWSEDIYSRAQQDRPYADVRLEAADRTMAAATLIVCSSPALTNAYPDRGNLKVVETVLPLAGWEPGRPDNIIAWWSDGRQKRGSEAVAPAMIEILAETGADFLGIGFAHQKPLMKGATTDEERRKRASRLYSYFPDDRTMTAKETLSHFRAVFSQAMVSLECYLPGTYLDRVSDLPLLRAAALGIPSVTTRTDPPPGCLGADPTTWKEAVLSVMRDPDLRNRTSEEALEWAAQRSTYEGYHAVLEMLRGSQDI